MNCQRDQFNLENGIYYLNGAYMSPLLNSSISAGIEGLRRKGRPYNFKREDFFEPADHCRSLFGNLINCPDPVRIVIVPSASYALANIAANISKNGRKKIILLQEQFPSNYYIWKRKALQENLVLQLIERPIQGNSWNEHILSAIDDETLVVSMPQIHWGDGTVFDLRAISQKAQTKGALFVLDGTQSIGAFPFDLNDVKANAIVVSGYKWLLGPYGMGFCYMDQGFDNGQPIEESWLNRIDSDDFQYLTDYKSDYRSGARRYEVGEAPDFIKMPMIEQALTQLLRWQPQNIQAYCHSIVKPILNPLKEAGYRIQNNENFAYHLFGIRLPDHLSMPNVKNHLAGQRINVSYRQDAIRVSPNVYNTLEELEFLKDSLIQLAHNC